MTTIATKYPFIGSLDTKQGGRNENQDNAGFVDTPLGLLLVVCDGMGGGPGGRTASLMAVDTILNVLSDVSEHTHRKDALKYAIEKANDIIYSKANETPELRGMGTTVATILFNEKSAVIAHAGDTRIYQLRKGAIVFRSSDHSVVANLVRQKQITEEEARNHPQANRITRALGIRPNIDIEFDEVAFLRGDRFIICTDGIWGMMPQGDLVKSLSRIMGINELTASLTEEIDKIGHLKGGEHDNLTLAIVDTTFDSMLQKNRHKPDTTENFYRNLLHGSSYIKTIFLLLSICILLVVILILYNSLSKNSNKQESHEKPLMGLITTTVKDNDVVTRLADTTSQRLNYNEDIKTPPLKEPISNPFQDSTIQSIEKKEFAHQINNLIRNIDSLKRINGSNKNIAMQSKRLFVKNNIVPKVIRLGHKVNTNKKKDIQDVLSMLKDSKTIECSRKGQTTAESKKYIEKIELKIKELQE